MQPAVDEDALSDITLKLGSEVMTALCSRKQGHFGGSKRCYLYGSSRTTRQYRQSKVACL